AVARSLWRRSSEPSFESEPSFIEIAGEAETLYFKTLDALVNEKQLRFLTRADLDDELMDLCWDIAAHPAHYADRARRLERLQQFFTNLDRPTVAFELVFNIEHLDVPAGEELQI